jgi:hypothetical protein
MDLVVILEYFITGQPLNTSFVLFGQLIGGGVMVGIFLHLLFGSILGLLYGALISNFDAFSIDSMSKGLKGGRHGWSGHDSSGLYPVCSSGWRTNNNNDPLCHHTPSCMGFSHGLAYELSLDYL